MKSEVIEKTEQFFSPRIKDTHKKTAYFIKRIEQEVGRPVQCRPTASKLAAGYTCRTLEQMHSFHDPLNFL